MRTSPARNMMEAYYAGSDRNMDDEVRLHQSGGMYVYRETEDLVMMARGVDSGAEPWVIQDPHILFDQKACDAWYIHLLIGGIAAVAPVAEQSWGRMKYLCYMRGGRGDLRMRKLTFAPILTKLLRLSGGKHTTQQ